MSKLTICPFISSNNGVTRCHPSCALLIDGKCAFRVLAETQLAEKLDCSAPQSSN